MSIEEKKVRVYDISMEIQRLQEELIRLNQEIANESAPKDLSEAQN